MMKRLIPILLVILLSLSLAAGCTQKTVAPQPETQAPAASAAPAEEKATPAPAEEPLKIAYFVSDLSNVFHQAQYDAAKKYAAEKYGAEVYVFDGQGDGAIMTQNIDQILAQGMDMATLHVWDDEAAIPGIKECLAEGVTMASFFGPFVGTGIPCVRSDEAGVSHQMGVEMATKWKEANPDKPIVMVQLGWPNHTQVKSGRTDPFVEGVLSVAPDAKNLGCLDAGAGADAAKQIMTDLLVTNPEVNLIYSEASNLTVGTMTALRDAGRGVFDKDGKPLTEIVCSVDFDQVEIAQVYDPMCSLKCSMGLPPIETAQARIDNLFAIRNGEMKQIGDTEIETFAKAYCISFWSMDRADAVKWLNEQFGTDVK